MSFIELNQLSSFINKRGIETKKVIQKPEISVMNLELKPEEEIEKHEVDVQVVFVVLYGTGKIFIGEEGYKVAPTNVVLCEPNTPMALKAGKEGMSFLNIKAPNPF